MFESLPSQISELRASVDAAPLVDAALDWARVVAVGEAQRLSCITEWAAHYLIDDDDACLCAVDEEDDVVAQIGIAFGLSRFWALHDLQIGAAMKERFPGLAALFLQGEIVSVDPGRSAWVAPGLFPGAALPNRTCDFHRIRLSIGQVGAGVQGVAMFKPR